MISNSTKETKRIAAEIAKKLLKAKINPIILALTGDLGSGKTFFTKNFLRALGVRKKVASPTFVIIREYELRDKKYKKAYHIDTYRLTLKELAPLGLKEILKENNSIVLIEWAEKIKSILPKNTIWIKFKHGKKENQRIINLSS